MNVTLYGLQNLPPVLSKLESRALWDLQRTHLPGITEGYSQSRRNNVVCLARMPVAIRPRFCPRRPCVPNSSQVPAQSLRHTSQLCVRWRRHDLNAETACMDCAREDSPFCNRREGSAFFWKFLERADCEDQMTHTRLAEGDPDKVMVSHRN
jgi:hypothetical protein